VNVSVQRAKCGMQGPMAQQDDMLLHRYRLIDATRGRHIGGRDITDSRCIARRLGIAICRRKHPIFSGLTSSRISEQSSKCAPEPDMATQCRRRYGRVFRSPISGARRQWRFRRRAVDGARSHGRSHPAPFSLARWSSGLHRIHRGPKSVICCLHLKDRGIGCRSRPQVRENPRDCRPGL